MEGGCYRDEEGRASLLFVVNLVLVPVLGLRGLVLLLVRGGSVQVVKGCGRRKDVAGRGPWRQAGGGGPFQDSRRRWSRGRARPSVRPHSEGPQGLRVTPLA